MYYIIYPLLYLVSLLPFFVLYAISDFCAFLLGRVFRYRRDVVLYNLRIAFPAKTEQERKRIAQRFYHYFTDSFIETIKLISISKSQLQKRTSSNYDLVRSLLQQGKSVNLLLGHQFNWEYGNLAYAATMEFPFVTVYLPVKNKAFDRIMLKIRGRFGSIMISPSEFGTRMHNVFKGQYAMVLIADQSPALPTAGYWINFFGYPTSFLAGPEKSAIRHKTAIVFFGFKRIKRGHYHFDAELIAEDATSMPERGRIIGLYSTALENAIRNDPANYLWSHRRFKFGWKPEYGRMLG
jgi:KDO2-lipid IV(A) lauroyltransferase